MDATQKQYTFFVDGIRCLGCVNQIEKVVRSLPGVEGANVNLQNKTLDAKLTHFKAVDRLHREVSKLGFKLIPADSPSAEAVAEQSARRSLKELGVAGACAGNIMMFAIPIYAGLEGSLKTAFEFISFFLFLPVLCYSARPFYKGAWSAFKSRRVNIDLPITIALILTTFFSVYGLFAGTGQIYFDSTASFVFLILGTRYLMEKSRRQLLTPFHLKDVLGDSLIEVVRGSEREKRPYGEICVGDRLILKSGQVLPVEARCLSAVAQFDSSFVDGESLPRVYRANSQIPSGYRAIGEVELEATSTVANSELAQFVAALNRTTLSSAAAVTQGDRLATRLITFITLYAGIVMVSGFWFGWSEMIARGTAILVIACPCALAFASPVTIGGFLKRALVRKIFIREGVVLENAAKIKNVFLDKTGTLTEGQLELIEAKPGFISEETKALILALENISEHPVAFAFRRAWPVIEDELPVLIDHVEVPGRGVQAKHNNCQVAICSLDAHSTDDDLVVGLFVDGKVVAQFTFRDKIRRETRHCLKQLRERGLQLYILSGDRDSRAKRVGRALGISEENIFSEKSPEQKAAIVKEHENAMMIGDGLNDALALKSALVGIAVRGSYAGALQSASVFMGESGLTPILEFFKISDECLKTLRRNFALALTYNISGGLLATFGYVNPLFAAIAMPISSVLILISTHWGVRKWRS